MNLDRKLELEFNELYYSLNKNISLKFSESDTYYDYIKIFVKLVVVLRPQ